MLACRVGASRSPHEVLINGFPRREEVLAYLAGFPNTKWNTKVHDNHPLRAGCVRRMLACGR
jgi:hypothetical protein